MSHLKILFRRLVVLYLLIIGDYGLVLLNAEVPNHFRQQRHLASMKYYRKSFAEVEQEIDIVEKFLARHQIDRVRKLLQKLQLQLDQLDVGHNRSAKQKKHHLKQAFHRLSNQLTVQRGNGEESSDNQADEDMVLIPAGVMASVENGEQTIDIDISAFYMDRYEVTNAEYKRFVEATNHPTPASWQLDSFNNPQQPVVGITWYDARAYTRWAKKRLPTEVEWEYAARGGLSQQEYPLGEDEPQSNLSGIGEEDQWGATAPVGRFKPNAFGLYDMAGNANEWCLDPYQPDAQQSSADDVATKQLDRNASNGRDYTSVKIAYVLRGGSWNNTKKRQTIDYRHACLPYISLNVNGFRCVKSTD